MIHSFCQWIPVIANETFRESSTAVPGASYPICFPQFIFSRRKQNLLCMCISLCEHMCVKLCFPPSPFPTSFSLQQWAWGRFWKEPGQPLSQRRPSDLLVPGQPGPQQRKHQAPPTGGAALGPASCTNRGPPVCSLCMLPGETIMPTPTTRK